MPFMILRRVGLIVLNMDLTSVMGILSGPPDVVLFSLSTAFDSSDSRIGGKSLQFEGTAEAAGRDGLVLVVPKKRFSSNLKFSGQECKVSGNSVHSHCPHRN